MIDQLVARFEDAIGLVKSVSPSLPPAHWQRLVVQAEKLADDIRAKDTQMFHALVARVAVDDQAVRIMMDGAGIRSALGLPCYPGDPENICCPFPVRVGRVGQALRLVDTSGTGPLSPPNEALVRLINAARRYWGILREGKVTIGALALQEGITASWLTRLVRVAFLAPPLVEAIVDGRQRAGLTTLNLLRLCEYADWDLQSQLAAERASDQRRRRIEIRLRRSTAESAPPARPRATRPPSR